MNHILTPGSDIQKAISAADPCDVIELQSGVYPVAQPITCMDKPLAICGRNATLLYSGQDACLTMGFSPGNKAAGGTGGLGFSLEGVAIICHGGGSTGLVWQNIYGGKVYDLQVNCFDIGMRVVADGVGCTCNDFHMRGMAFNSTSLQVRVSNGGYANENTWWGGNWQTGPMNGKQPWGHLDLQGAGSSAFIRCCMQIGDSPAAVWANLASCADLCFILCRWESLRGLPFKLDASSVRNRLRGATCNYILWKDATDHMSTNAFDPNW